MAVFTDQSETDCTEIAAAFRLGQLGPAPDRSREIWLEISALPGVRETLTAFALSSMIKR